MKSRVIKKKEHFIYNNLEEFQRELPDTNVFFDWRTSKEGDWVMSDDNKIFQLFKVSNDIKHPND